MPASGRTAVNLDSTAQQCSGRPRRFNISSQRKFRRRRSFYRLVASGLLYLRRHLDAHDCRRFGCNLLLRGQIKCSSPRAPYPACNACKFLCMDTHPVARSRTDGTARVLPVDLIHILWQYTSRGDPVSQLIETCLCDYVSFFSGSSQD